MFDLSQDHEDFRRVVKEFAAAEIEHAFYSVTSSIKTRDLLDVELPEKLDALLARHRASARGLCLGFRAGQHQSRDNQADLRQRIPNSHDHQSPDSFPIGERGDFSTREQCDS